MRTQERQSVRQLPIIGILDISLIENHQDMLRHGSQELLQRCGAEPGTCRVIGVGDKHDPGVRINGGLHGIQIMPPLLGSNSPGLSAHSLGSNGINRKRMLAEHGIEARG